MSIDSVTTNHDSIGLEAQADAVKRAAQRLGTENAVLVEAERTLRLLNRLAILLQEQHDDEDASEELTTHLLAILRISVSS